MQVPTKEDAAIDIAVRAGQPDATVVEWPRRRSRAGFVNAVVFTVVLAGYAALVWNRRWVSDDGLIVLRTVRNLLAGDGPVFNAGERVEANTSTLWTYLLALPGLVPGVSLNWASVVLGLVLAVGGVGLAMDGARRLTGADAVLPLGALVVLALPPFWDFGTSGLETGLISGWLGLTWWLLVRRWQGRVPAWPVAFLLGLGPLVRPDLALVGVLVAVALVVLEWRPGRPNRVRRTLGLAGVAVAVPVAYEIFRAGYYGLLVPSTALAKEAGVARWRQGAYYLADLVRTYWLWIPAVTVLAGMVVLALAAVRRGAGRRPATLAVAAVPVVSGLLLVLYVTRVGGDFMHGRMLLPAVFCLLMPVMVVPARRLVALPVVATALWALACMIGLRTDYGAGVGPYGIANERAYYVALLGVAHPVTAEDYRSHPLVPDGVAALGRDPGPSIALTLPGKDGLDWWLTPADRDTLVWLNLGVSGELAPLDVRVLDGVGLVNPVAAHSTSVPDGRIGHDKQLGLAWFLADHGVPGADLGPHADLRPAVEAARAALACPATAEMLASVRAPLTAERFRANLVGAPERTGYRYSSDAFEAAAACASGGQAGKR